MEGGELYQFKQEKRGAVDKLKSEYFLRLQNNQEGGEVFKCCLCGEVFSKQRVKVKQNVEKQQRLRFKLDFFYGHLVSAHKEKVREIRRDHIPQDRDCRMKLRKFFKEEGWKGDKEVVDELQNMEKKGRRKRKMEEMKSDDLAMSATK